MGKRADLGWWVFRVVFGLSLAWGHGLPKVMGGHMDSFARSVGAMGFPSPTFFAWCAALSELLGGLLVALGLFTRPAAAFAGITMAVALYSNRKEAFGQLELSLLYLVAMIAVLAMGPGTYALENRFRFKRRIGF